MIRIGICDDSYDARLNLKFAMERIFEARHVEYKIFEFSMGERLLAWLENHAGELDLIFLDIKMGGQNGMEIARQIRLKDTNMLLAFCTSFTDFVFDGYSVNALGYLIKPPKTEQLNDLLTRAFTMLHREEKNMFICKCNEILYRIPKADILYFYSDKRQVICVTDKKEYTFYAKLDDVEKEAGGQFVRIHQRYLVGVQAVEKIEAGAVIIRGSALPVSRSCQNSATLALTRAMLE